jgi:hypothetical protein
MHPLAVSTAMQSTQTLIDEKCHMVIFMTSASFRFQIKDDIKAARIESM